MKEPKTLWPVAELEEYFKTADLPEEIQLDECTRIVNVRRFVDAHLTMAEANNGNPTFYPYYKRLCKLKELLK